MLICNELDRFTIDFAYAEALITNLKECPLAHRCYYNNNIVIVVFNVYNLNS